MQTDANGHYVYVNDLWCQITGLSLETARGFAWTQALHPDDRERVIEAWYNAAQRDQLFSMEYRFQRADGLVTWVLGKAAAERDAKGRVVGFVGTITDITERKQAEAALWDSQQTISNLLASINDGFFSLDTQWCFSYLNETAAQLFKRDQTALLHQNIWQVLPEIGQLEFCHRCQEAVATQKDLTFEEFLPCCDVWVEVHAYPFVGGISVYFRDITARKQTEMPASTRRWKPRSRSRLRRPIANSTSVFAIRAWKFPPRNTIASLKSFIEFPIAIPSNTAGRGWG